MRLASLLLLLPLSACVTVAAQPPVGDGPTATCRDDALGVFAGQPATSEVGARMLGLSGARVIRWVPYGSAVTMEFRGDRLTVQLDRSNRIERATCG